MVFDLDTTSESVSITDQPSEFRSAFRGVLELLIKERGYRERAEARLEQVENILNDNIITAIDNLQRDVMKLSILLSEPNKAREEIHRSLSEKDAINKVLEVRIPSIINHTNYIICSNNLCSKLTFYSGKNVRSEEPVRTNGRTVTRLR